uniref:RNase H type-1 domain-containing protein n=1 Tax=Cannabis sativa TaxID=3483 RepID=A0A803R3Z0_CANSA
MLKINTDGMIFAATTQYGTGIVIRDFHGKLIEARSSLHPGACQPAVVEALSVKEALSWLKMRNLSNVLIETDCIAVVQAINSSVALPYVFGLFVQECQSILSILHNVSVCRVKRSANKTAHCVARGACFWSDSLFTESNVPSALQSIVIADIAI